MKKKSTFAGYAFLFLSVLFQLALSSVGQARKFVIPVLPDTQNKVKLNPVMFMSQMNWIVAEKDSPNIPSVLQTVDKRIKENQGFSQKIFSHSHVPIFAFSPHLLVYLVNPNQTRQR